MRVQAPRHRRRYPQLDPRKNRFLERGRAGVREPPLEGEPAVEVPVVLDGVDRRCRLVERGHHFVDQLQVPRAPAGLSESLALPVERRGRVDMKIPLPPFRSTRIKSGHRFRPLTRLVPLC